MKLNRPDFSVILDAIERKTQPARIPFFELFVDAEICEEIMGYRFAQLESEPDRYFSQLISFYVQLGYDYVPFYQSPRFPSLSYIEGDDTATYSRKKRNWINEKAGPIQTFEDVEKAPWPSIDTAVDYSLFECLGKQLPQGMKIIGGAAGGPFEHASFLMGIEKLSIAVYEEPELVAELFSRISDILVGAAERIVSIESVGAYCFGDDLGYKTATIFSPKLLRQFVFPVYKKIAQTAHASNKPFILHSCGNLEEVMDDIIDAGVDAKHSFEDVILPVTEAKKRWGNRISILGGIDVDFLCHATPEQVRTRTLNTLQACAPGGGYALGTGNTVTNYVPIKNYLAMIEAGNEFNLSR
ncbi:MAG TPA: uroporphyrinogen-III decarboxylase-like protein [Kosmotogaceae bacterium]|nr:uroporphyrinogen-III decarboxylase-like protein [Kosmotogaceae bacterium]